MSYGINDDCNRTPNFSYAYLIFSFQPNEDFTIVVQSGFLSITHSSNDEDKGDLDKGRVVCWPVVCAFTL